MKKISVALATVLCLMLLLTGCDVSDISGGLINFDNIANNLDKIGELLQGYEGERQDLETDMALDDLLQETDRADDTEVEVERPDRPNNPNQDETDTPNIPELGDNAPMLSNKNYGGKEVSIATVDNRNDVYHGEEWEGNILNAATYARNMEIENTLNVTLCFNIYFDARVLSNALTNICYAQDNSISFASGEIVYLNRAAANGILGDWRNTTVDIEKEWWYENEVEQFTSPNSGRLFVLSGDYAVSAIDRTSVTFFNRDMLANFGVSDSSLYASVINDKWTLDSLVNLAINAYCDDNANAQIDVGDTFGLYVTPTSIYSTIAGIGEHTLKYSNGKYSLGFDTDSLAYVADSFVGVMNDFNMVNVSKDSKTAFEEFRNGRVLFFTDALGRAESFDAVNYGILPNPAVNLGRNASYSMVMPTSTALAYVNLSDNDKEVISDVVDLLGYYGQLSVLPVYYTKIAYTQNDMEMLDEIRDSLYFDSAYIMNYGSFYSVIASRILNGEAYVNSTVASYSSKLLNEATEWLINVNIVELY